MSSYGIIREKRQMYYAEEFQIICVDTLLLKEYPYYAAKDFLPKNTVWKQRKQSTFMAQKPDKNYLSQVIVLYINSYKSC